MWPALLSAGASLLGGWLNKSSADRAQDQQNQIAQQNIALQREFAQQGIQWKVEDAKKAGIHPLYALGAQTTSFAPVSVGSVADTSMGSAVAQSGQDISRAINATRNSSDRATAVTKTMQDLQLQRMGLENELLASQIAKTRAPAVGPAMPVGQRWLMEGQGDVPASFNERFAPALVKSSPMERTATDPGRPFSEPGAVADVGYARTAGGGYAAVPSADVKQRIEDNFIQEIMWAIRNNLLPSLGINQAPPNVPAGKDERWMYHPFHQEYRRHRKSRFGFYY